MTPPTGDHKGPPIPSPPPSPLRMLILIGRPQWHAPTIYDSLWLSPFAQGLSCFAALSMTGLYIRLSSYEFCAFAPLDGASPVPTIYGGMVSNEFCHIHYTLLWSELQYLRDKCKISVTSDATDANVTIITRKYDLSAPPQSNVCSNSKSV